MFESPVVQISILSFILVVVVLIYLVRSEIVQNKIFDLNAIGYKPFFYKNMLNGEEHISFSLKKLLQLKDNDNNISNLLGILIKKDQELLTQIYNNLAQLNQPYENRNNTDADIAIKLKLKNIEDVTHLSCQHLVLRDQTGFAHGFFLFFANITEDMARFDYLAFENKKLSRKLQAHINLLDSIPTPIWTRDNNLKITYFNDRYSKIIAYHKGMEQTALELDSQSINLARKVKDSGELQQEERHIIVDGQRCLYQIYEVPIEQSKSLSGIGFDMTSKELIKSELDRHISAQSDLLESTASATAIYGADMRLQFFNQAFVRLWDLNERWLVTQPTYSQILEKLREKRKLPEQADFQKFKSEQIKLFTNIISPYNEFFYLPNGAYLRVIVIQHALGGLLFSYEDITDRLQLERSVKTLSAVQKETIDNLNEGISAFGENGKLELNNPKFLAMWKIDEQFTASKPHITEVLSNMYIKCKPKMHASEFHEQVLKAFSSRISSNIILKLEDGSIIDTLFVPLPDGGTLICYQDITDATLVEVSLREKNMALEDADRLKTEFLESVSYELRSPLTSIVGFTEILNRGLPGILNKKQIHYVEAIHNSSNHLMLLINDILDLASIEAGHMQLELSNFDIYKAIQSIPPLIQARLRKKDLKIEVICSSDIGYMLGDEKRIKQTLFKLITNAIDISSHNDSILLEASKDKDDIVTISVSGSGINKDLLNSEHLFDKNHNKETTSKSSKSAAGLGLALVKRFVELHGGTVNIINLEHNKIQFNCLFKSKHPELAAIFKEESENKLPNK